jgi:carbonic anhydrase
MQRLALPLARRLGAVRSVRACAARFSGASGGGGEDASDPADHNLELILEHNKRWVAETNETDPEFFTELGKGQSPEYLYIGCSDSRVVASEMMGVGLGELFVHRNVANLVVANDVNLLSVLNYAVAHLDVKHILVTGHYDCGGVRAAMKNQELGILDTWLQHVRDVARIHKDELQGIEDPEDRHRRFVELNVTEQCLNVYKTSVVQRKRLETHNDPGKSMTYPRIHGLVFDPSDGVLNKLDIDYRAHIAELGGIYDLFDWDQEHYMLRKGRMPKPGA